MCYTYIYTCHKCKMKTKYISLKVVQTNNILCGITVQCSIYKTNKNKSTKKPEEEIKLSTGRKFNKQ